MRRNILQGFLSILGAQVTILLISFLTTPFLVRFLGSSQYGDYAFLLSILSLTMIVANAGIFDGTRKYIAEDREQPNWIEHVFGFYIRMGFGLALAISFIYMALSWGGFSKQLFGEDFTVYFYLLGVLIISRQAYSVVRGGLMGLGLEDRSEPLSVFKKVFFGLVSLSLAYLGYGVAGVLIGHIVASFTIATIAFALLHQKMDSRVVFSRIPSSIPKRELLSFNTLSVVLILLTASLYHVDILLLRSIVGSEETGYYRAALVIAEFLWFVPTSLQMVLLHSTSELWADNKTDQITNIVSRITRYNLSLVILLALGLAALASDIIPLYFGSEFEPAVLPLLLLLPGVLGFALARPIFAVGQGKGDIRILIVATGGSALLNFCLNILLIPRYGTAGAAIATSISYGSMAVFHIFAAQKIGFNPISNLKIKNITSTVVLSGGIIFGISSIINSSFLSLIVVPPIGFAVYVALLIKLMVVSPQEVDEFTQHLPHSVRRYVRHFINIVG
ncbi:oligosaccharide flippase family protein [Natrinema saccharevitans]|uniref:oligosaccharide flippase family protein n=1 Tax=Natrinema saccharevitans TaxID=301967 RepID=UPI00096D1DFA|nr:polysaccharide biosynthesis C-terminal domain-containing protein [Natrinema saccharevitans]